MFPRPYSCACAAAARSFDKPPVRTPAAPAEITSKNVLRFIADKICCRDQLSTLTCSPRDEPAVVGRAVTFLTRRSFSEGGTLNCQLALVSLSDLRTRWEWDPLWKDPRFEKILAGPEPKTTYK
jgi:hypothetical protein